MTAQEGLLYRRLLECQRDRKTRTPRSDASQKRERRILNVKVQPLATVSFYWRFTGRQALHGARAGASIDSAGSSLRCGYLSPTQFSARFPEELWTLAALAKAEGALRRIVDKRMIRSFLET